MSKSDQWVNIILLLLILLHFTVWVIGYFTNKPGLFISLLNIFAGASVIIYWASREMSIRQHFVESREIVVLCFELVVIGSAVYYMATGNKINFLKVMQYIFFAVHLLTLILFSLFLLTFKMNRMM